MAVMSLPTLLPRRYRFILTVVVPLLIVAILLRSLRYPGTGSHQPQSRTLRGVVGTRSRNPHPGTHALLNSHGKSERSLASTPSTAKRKLNEANAAGIHDVKRDQENNDDYEDDNDDDVDEWFDEDALAIPYRGDYRELFSLTTRDRKFWPIHMDGLSVYNPNIIPHPTKSDQWLVVATHPGQGKAEGLTCAAGPLNDVLVCSSAPQNLETAPSIEGNCVDGNEYVNFYTGPRDARAFYGPDTPYVMYGSQSQYICVGLWMQDVRPLLEDFHISQGAGNKLFRTATELRRPLPVPSMEKNYFVFWASDGKVYAHYEFSPRRVFAQLDFDGSVGQDLAPYAASHDKFCMAKYMPVPLSSQENIEQASNALLITMCKRGKCQPSSQNTFVMHIFQHKSYYQYHSLYEPYVILFNQTAPFEIYAIGQRPYWIHGRTNLTKETHAREYEEHPEKIPPGHSEMFYITSMSWKKHGQRYHGYMDDPLWLSFGIEDSRAAAMDVLAGDLFEDLAYC